MTGRAALALHWIALAVLSLVFVAGLGRLQLPAALLLGSLAAAALIASAGARLNIWPPAFYGAQGVVGCLIARVFALDTIAEIARDWPLFAGGVLSVSAAAAVIGWLLARWRVLPGATAVWGSSPGAASAMTLMSESYGADMRLVAFMQYLRVVLVVVVATVIARLAMASSPHAPAAIVWFPPLAWPSFAGTAAVIVVGAAAGRRLGVPAGPLIVPIAAGALLQDTGALAIVLPPWLLAFAYVTIGWSIGLRFTRAILVHAAKAAPRLLASIACLIAVCAGFGAALARLAHVDLLTAYLATSPGGADSVAIIAASSQVNVPFVMAMQTARFALVVLTGPALARFVAGRIPR